MSSSAQQAHHHRASSLKQKNKPFKSGKHASKSALRKQEGGSCYRDIDRDIDRYRTRSISNSCVYLGGCVVLYMLGIIGKVERTKRGPIKALRFLGKAERKIQARQARDNKRSQLVADMRRLSQGQAPPKVIGVISLSDRVDTIALCRQLMQVAVDDAASIVAAAAAATAATPSTTDASMMLASDDANNSNNAAAAAASPQQQQQQHPVAETPCMLTFYSSAWKQRLSLMSTASRELSSVLSIASVADLLLFVVHASAEIDEQGQQIATVIKAQGMPSSLALVIGLDELPRKRQHEHKKLLTKELQTSVLHEDVRVLSLEDAADSANLLRFLCLTKPTPIHWREQHAYVVAESVSFEQQEQQAAATDASSTWQPLGVLSVTGFVRGAGLSANDLVYLPHWGHFQVLRIDEARQPCPVPRHSAAADANAAAKVLSIPDPEAREQLVIEHEPSGMEGEQTLTNEERDELAQLGHAAGGLTVQQLLEEERAAFTVKKRVPKGTSEYQAAWIVDSDQEDADDDDEDDDADSDDGDDGDDGFDYGNKEDPEATMDEAHDGDEDGGDHATTSGAGKRRSRSNSVITASGDDDEIDMTVNAEELEFASKFARYAERRERERACATRYLLTLQPDRGASW